MVSSIPPAVHFALMPLTTVVLLLMWLKLCFFTSILRGLFRHSVNHRHHTYLNDSSFCSCRKWGWRRLERMLVWVSVSRLNIKNCYIQLCNIERPRFLNPFLPVQTDKGCAGTGLRTGCFPELKLSKWHFLMSHGECTGRGLLCHYQGYWSALLLQNKLSGIGSV